MAGISFLVGIDGSLHIHIEIISCPFVTGSTSLEGKAARV
jgi:hypothetical protein